MFSQVIKLRKMNEKCDQLQSSEDTLRVKNAELLNSIEIREDECRRAVEEKEQVNDGYLSVKIYLCEFKDHPICLASILAILHRRS